MLIQKFSQNLKNGKLVSLYDSVPFILECFITLNMPRSAKKHHESTRPEDQKDFLLSGICLVVQGFILNPGKGGISPSPKNHGLES